MSSVCELSHQISPVKWSVPYIGFSTLGFAMVAISAPSSFYLFLNRRKNIPSFVRGADNVEFFLQIRKSKFCDFSRKKTQEYKNNIGDQSSKHSHITGKQIRDGRLQAANVGQTLSQSLL